MVVSFHGGYSGISLGGEFEAAISVVWFTWQGYRDSAMAKIGTFREVFKAFTADEESTICLGRALPQCTFIKISLPIKTQR